jgi:hypothetical protein
MNKVKGAREKELFKNRYPDLVRDAREIPEEML